MGYNQCRNLEWQICAAMGKLPGQGGVEIQFATPPSSIAFDGPWFHHCTGYKTAPCSSSHGFANDDVFFTEVCTYSIICSNGNELLDLSDGQSWRCNLSDSGMQWLKEKLLDA